VLAFVFGAGTFVAANVVLFVLAYPTLPNPGPQSDIRLPLTGLVVGVLVIALLLGRPGRAFGYGFSAGLLAETLFMSNCTTHLFSPGGTALANAEYERQRPGEEALALQRYRAKWMSDVRHRGLDLATGVSRLRLVTGCVLAYQEKHGQLPSVYDSLPDTGESCS